MKLSTRSRYGVRLMFDLALHHSKDYVQLKDAAKRQNISEKYLSKLVIPLRGAGFVNSARGYRGGYSLAGNPSAVTLWDIIEILEGDMVPVECVRDRGICERSGFCPTLDVWCTLSAAIQHFLQEISLQDLVTQFREKMPEPVIEYSI